MGTHLQADEGLDFSTQPTRLLQAKEVSHWIQTGVKQGKFNILDEEPVFVAGDLNVPFMRKHKGKRDKRKPTYEASSFEKKNHHLLLCSIDLIN